MVDIVTLLFLERSLKMEKWKVGDTVPFSSRISGDPASDNPIAIIYDEANAIESTLTIGSGLTQIFGTKIVVGSFVPDVAGTWRVQFLDDAGLDITKQFIIGSHSVESVGGVLGVIDGKIDAQDLVLAAILANTATIGGGGHFG